MNFEQLHPADQIVMIMERIYTRGLTTTSGGNLSVLDGNGDVWITPGGVDKGSLTRKDIVCVKPDGTVEGIHKPSIELPFHQTVYSKRPDIHAVLHAHAPALIAFSIVRRIPDIRLTPYSLPVCGEVGVAGYAVPGSMELGGLIADVMGRGVNCVMLENHGAVTAGSSLFHAFEAYETLDYCARLQIEAGRLGRPVALDDGSIGSINAMQAVRLDEFAADAPGETDSSAREELCAFVHRAYQQQLFTSTQGAYSMRLALNRFLITPARTDRMYIEPADLVLMDGSRKERGKTPSGSVLLHKAVYDAHPHVNAIITAAPPHIMAFAVTGQAFDSRLIPESYVMLRGVPMLPFAAGLLNPIRASSALAADTPVALVENDCAIVTGASVLNAFDRLEVAEYSARAIIAGRALGEIATIGSSQIAEIDRVFNL